MTVTRPRIRSSALQSLADAKCSRPWHGANSCPGGRHPELQAAGASNATRPSTPVGRPLDTRSYSRKCLPCMTPRLVRLVDHPSTRKGLRIIRLQRTADSFPCRVRTHAVAVDQWLYYEARLNRACLCAIYISKRSLVCPVSALHHRPRSTNVAFGH